MTHLSPSSDRRPEAFSEISSQEVVRLVQQAGVPGCSILQVDRSGATRGMAVGTADFRIGRAMSLDTVSHLYSGTKVVTAAALMRLVEENHVSLESNIQKLLPDLPFRFPLTLKQLASHDSGLSDSLRAFVALHFPEEQRPSTAQALSKFDLSKGKRPNGTATYKNINYALLAEVISRVSERDYERYVGAELFSPWNSSAAFTVRSFPTSSLATGYLRRFDPIRLAAPFILGEKSRGLFGEQADGYVPLHPFDLDCAGIGGLVGSVFDFAPILDEFLSEEDGALSADSKRTMLSKHATGKVGVVSDQGVGLAWKLGSAQGTPYWNHEGGGPGFCSELRLYPQQGHGFILLMNLSQSRQLSTLAHQICELLRQDS